MNANELADELSWSEMDTDEIETWTKEAIAMLRQQQAEIANLKHMNFNWQISEGMLLSELDALKAHPVKELTDEEIDELANKYLYVLNDIPYSNDIKDFARAILRKAQENG